MAGTPRKGNSFKNNQTKRKCVVFFQQVTGNTWTNQRKFIIDEIQLEKDEKPSNTREELVILYRRACYDR